MQHKSFTLFREPLLCTSQMVLVKCTARCTIFFVHVRFCTLFQLLICTCTNKNAYFPYELNNIQNEGLCMCTNKCTFFFVHVQNNYDVFIAFCTCT